ncbi:nuclear transport factor 2 family protein [Edaphobacter bradus]|uniref:nuclear transport factor 2 family protein n=1 Tax=Edaphobacter bradus TaxID=2259016 RepID=UPI0021E02252|nr:nuclear transport factor 2 family protein [Edaphobacter bradus]
MRFLTTSATVLCAILTSASFATAATPDVKLQTRLFLDAYARGDRDTVLPMLDPAITVYASDAAEIFRGTEAVTTLLANDQRLWGGPAHIGEMEDTSIVQQGPFASLFFDASFSAGGQPPVLVRFAMVWKLTDGKWLLIQGSNVVPTRGQSAAELLKKN